MKSAVVLLLGSVYGGIVVILLGLKGAEMVMQSLFG